MTGTATSSVHRPTLDRSASGLRHLRWAREVLGTLTALAALAAHDAHDASNAGTPRTAPFSDPQRAALRAEIEHVAALVSHLSAAVKPYRDFLERTRTLARGELRAAEIIGDSSAHEAAAHEMATVIEPARRALHVALAAAIDKARDGLHSMDERLLATFPAEIVAAFYPPLTPDRTRVLDDGDPDDDATAGP